MSSNKAIAYIDKAVMGVTNLGKQMTKEQLPVQDLIQQVSQFGTDEAMTISLVLAHQGQFNELVRDEITGMEIASRYELITAGFNSVREDIKKHLSYAEKGHIGVLERLVMRWGDFRRGSIPSRFQKIKTTYTDVSLSMRDQIDREKRVLEAYADYRFAMKDAESQAHKLLANATAALEDARTQVQEAQNALDTKNTQGISDQERSSLELVRDEKQRNFQTVDEQYQIAKDLADQLTVAYNASEFVFARSKQVNDVKRRLFNNSVSFFSTSEIVFTGQAAAFNSMQGLQEGTRTLNAMKDGMNQGLEDLAELGGKALEEGLRAGYGPGLKAESIKKLVDSVVNHQESSYKLIEELRLASTENTAETARIAEDGKQRFAALINKAAAR